MLHSSKGILFGCVLGLYDGRNKREGLAINLQMRRVIAISLLKLLVIVGSLMMASSAYSWGSLGHQVVCDIAWRSSAPAVQRQLASAAKRMGYKTFAESCTWADKIKSQSRYDSLKPLHYMNIDRRDAHVRSAACVSRQPPQCVLPAIQYYLDEAKNTALSQKQRDKAVLLLGHFVADIHQPLHVSYKDDRGGTRKMVVYQGKLMNLHRLWDTQLLYCQGINGKRPTWRRLGAELFNRPQPSLEKIQLPLIEWAQESFEITKTIYKEINGSNKKTSLANDYCERHYPVVLSQLQLASGRLAALLAGD